MVKNMNTLQIADTIGMEKFGRKFYSLGEFEQKQVVKIIAGTVAWR
jgi:hypothetical protein